ncbi:hypothetical protein [Bacillus cereus]|uniref:Uncharacterized protein n=1 Tax=Bacillus cereus TaxID=1396 RepID=A0A161SHP7_BACCE|nr:hypothetical protein [Bacillus cereus]KZD71218.1 hypothetical protein B4088_0948 [Bacillus cereus]HDR8321312.1 hypothetical protein [Bacillus cereus]HDR8330240.1 hypothetical protein [Bacillus cereus]HDR8334291.1 hypothetical protein [Bacillus cereus]
MENKLKVAIRFFDGKGHFEQKYFECENMIELTVQIEVVVEELITTWKAPVSWRKNNLPNTKEKVIKVKIDNNEEEHFKEMLTERGLFYIKHFYTPELIIWRVDIRTQQDEEFIQKKSYVLKTEEMPRIHT